MVHDFLTNMYTKRADFVYTVTRDFVRSCQTPILVLPDDVPAHPYAVAMEQVVANISHSGRVRTWRQHLGPGQPTSSPGRAMAPVLRPHRFCRATRQWVMRTPKDKGGYQYAVVLTTVSDLEPATVRLCRAF